MLITNPTLNPFVNPNPGSHSEAARHTSFHIKNSNLEIWPMQLFFLKSLINFFKTLLFLEAGLLSSYQILHRLKRPASNPEEPWDKPEQMQPVCQSFLRLKFFLSVYTWSACVYVCTPCMCLASVEARRRGPIPWNRIIDLCGLLGTEPASSSRAPNVWAVFPNPFLWRKPWWADNSKSYTNVSLEMAVHIGVWLK